MKTSLVFVAAGVVFFAIGCAGPSAPSTHTPLESFPAAFTFTGDYDRAPLAQFMPRTVYPPSLVERGRTGTATIAFKLKPDGYVGEARVESATEPAFGAAALGTVAQMVFTPAVKAGKGVFVSGRVTFPFELK